MIWIVDGINFNVENHGTDDIDWEGAEVIFGVYYCGSTSIQGDGIKVLDQSINASIKSRFHFPQFSHWKDGRHDFSHLPPLFILKNNNILTSNLIFVVKYSMIWKIVKLFNQQFRYQFQICNHQNGSQSFIYTNNRSIFDTWYSIRDVEWRCKPVVNTGHFIWNVLSGPEC